MGGVGVKFYVGVCPWGVVEYFLYFINDLNYGSHDLNYGSCDPNELSFR